MSDQATLTPGEDNDQPPEAATHAPAPAPAPPAHAPGLTRDRIRQAIAAPRRDRVWIDQWGCFAHIRVMTGKERDGYEAEITGTRVRQGDNVRTLNLTNIRARLVARCLIDGETGETLYDWRKPGDLDELGALDAAILDIIFNAVSELNGITKKDIDQLTKNSTVEANGVSGLV